MRGGRAKGPGSEGGWGMLLLPPWIWEGRATPATALAIDVCCVVSAVHTRYLMTLAFCLRGLELLLRLVAKDRFFFRDPWNMADACLFIVPTVFMFKYFDDPENNFQYARDAYKFITFGRSCAPRAVCARPPPCLGNALASGRLFLW